MKIKRLLVFLLLLGSCARVPPSDLALLSDPISLETTLETALAKEFFEEGGWPTEKWWEMFEDPQLNHLIELTTAHNPTIQQAVAKVAAAEAEAKKEKSALFPTLGAGYEEQWEYFSKNGFVRSFYPVMPSVVIPSTVNQLDLTLNFNYEIDFFGRNRNLFMAALGKARAERAEAKQATLIITTLVAQTYIELQTGLAQKQVLQDRLEERTALFELTTSRGIAGLDSALPVLDKEQSIYEVEQMLILLDKQIALDRHMLCFLVGLGPDADVTPKAMALLFERPVSLPANLSSDLLARRPDLSAQLWKVEAAAKEIGAAKADFYPRVNLMAFAGLESLAFNKLFKVSSKQGGLVPAIHLPIFTGGRLTANLRSKVALFNEETWKYNDLLLTAAREVADGIVTLSALFDALNCQINALETSEERVALQYSRHQKGISNLLSVLEKEEDLFTQRYQLYGYERDYLLSVLKIIKALGGGYHGNIP